MTDIITRIILSILCVVPLILISLLINDLPIPSNYHQSVFNPFNIEYLRPNNLNCWNEYITDDICKTYYNIFLDFKCSESYCAVMVPKGSKPDTGICINNMIKAPSGFIIDKNYGTCSPNPNINIKYILLLFTLIIFLNILFGNIIWITG